MSSLLRLSGQTEKGKPKGARGMPDKSSRSYKNIVIFAYGHLYRHP